MGFSKHPLLWTAAIIAVAGMVFSSALVWIFMQMHYTDRRIAEYDTFILGGSSNGYYYLLETGGETFDTHLREFYKPIADIYVRTPDGKVYFLPEFPEDVAKELVRAYPNTSEREAVSEYESEGDNESFYHLDGWIWMKFVNGRLIKAELAGTLLEFAASKEGPFYRFSIDKKTATKIFGPPKRIIWGTRSWHS